ncbi:hypothetical protein JVT61DRAFT_10938 [Boletus reticuloceps]|uniref:Uncharacterized protein n=1 Tax=Boletus reticuloceps TaxID=495285 RepID=A0A8I3A3Z3_9AGAM|nr:hypothetical protein JVT61DRAFT_10938 [Boletus reticuloceps]
MAALSRNEARVKCRSNVFGQARESGAARLSFNAPPPALAGSSSCAARASRCRPSPLPFRHSRLRLCHGSSRLTTAVQRPPFN